jgi:hypothetical protein
MQLTVLRPTALPGELAQGCAGRFARLNGCSCWLQACKKLLNHEANPYWDGPRSQNSQFLADVVGLPILELNSRHTLKPLVRGGSPGRSRHAKRSDKPYRARQFAYFCEDCAMEDIEFHGMSYWRREHQILGMYWCLKHATPLRYAAYSAPFTGPPSEYLLNSLDVDTAWLHARTAFPAINLALELASELCDISTGVDEELIFEKIFLLFIERRERCRSSPRLLSDLLLEMFGSSWLIENIPAFSQKLPGNFLPEVDRLNRSAFQNASALYIPVLIALTGSIDEALAEMHAPLLRSQRATRRGERASVA